MVAGLALLTAGGAATAAEDRVETRNGFTLEFRDLTGEADQAIVDQMIELFFDVYPQLVAEYNPAARRTVQLDVDPAYEGMAAASGGRIMINPGFLSRHPEHIDAVTHELMHVVQDYNFREAPPWLREGIADYVRDRYGLDDAASGWHLERRPPGSDWTMSYRVTGAFLRWVETNGRPGFVRSMNAALRNRTYAPETWALLTGQSLEALWAEYSLTETSDVAPDRPQDARLTPEQLARLHELSPAALEELRAATRGTGIEGQINEALGAATRAPAAEAPLAGDRSI